jgi:hypothetical protein
MGWSAFRRSDSAGRVSWLVFPAIGVASAFAALSARFAEGLALFRGRRFLEAREAFRELAALGDAPSAVYLARCDEFIQAPPPGNGTALMTPPPSRPVSGTSMSMGRIMGRFEGLSRLFAEFFLAMGVPLCY